jgi:hypothetical protein
METFINTIAYEEDFKSHIRSSGWGCGYVHIPKDHPILIKLIDIIGWSDYLTVDGCPEEITYSSWDENDEYYVIGFDTAHSYNNALHDEQYVTDRANEIKACVDAYTAEDASLYAGEQISLTIKKYSKYLI